MNNTGWLAAHKVFDRMLVGVIFALIYLACGNSVANHFDDVSERHFYRTHFAFYGIIVSPVFKVMLVSAFVMHPCKRISVFISLKLIGASCANIKSSTGKKFSW